MALQELKQLEDIVDPNVHLKALIGANHYLILKFYTQTCSPCKILQTKLEDMETKGKLDNYFILSIDGKEYPQLVESYKVKSVPHVFVLKDGKVLYDAKGLDDVKHLFTNLIPAFKWD